MVDSIVMQSGRYTAYPEYKDSGVEWLGEIPSGWDKSLLKHYLLSMTGGGTPDSSNESNWTDSGEGIPWVSIADITRSFEIKNTIKDVTRKGLSSKNLKVLPVDTVLYSIYASLGKVAVTKVPLVTNQAILGLETCKQLDSGFLVFWLIHIQPLLSLYSTSNTQENLNAEKVGSLPLYIPSLIEQKKITSFLDYETAKIDTLIEKQQRLIELLTEKRQAVISHAVTKGLNPDVPMKDSGVEWLGEVPEHWVVAQLKFNTVAMQTGPFGSQLHAEEYIENGIPLINPAHLINGDIVPDSSVTVDEATQARLSRHKLSEGDIVFARRGELGRCAVVKKSQEGWLCGTGSLRGTLNDKLIPEYAYLLITSKGVISELSLESKGSTMENLNTETLGRVRLPVPSISEQKAIINHVESVSGRYSQLITKAQKQVQLMQERRTALISSAVTGKIDVRDWVKPE